MLCDITRGAILGGAAQISNALMNNGLDARDGIKQMCMRKKEH
jgi:hypothetical protein